HVRAHDRWRAYQPESRPRTAARRNRRQASVRTRIQQGASLTVMSANTQSPSHTSLRQTAIRYGFLVLLLGIVTYFSVAADGFFSPQSGVFILQSVSITGILALGVTATLVVGGFDLSIGSVATTALMASAYVMVILGGDAFTATVVCILIGAVVGLINGFLIVYMRVPDLLATLGMMFLLLGLQRIPTEGR